MIDSQLPGPITDMAGNATGKLLACGSENGMIRVMEVNGDEVTPQSCLQSHKTAITRLSWAHTCFTINMLLSGSEDGQLTVWKDVSGDLNFIESFTKVLPKSITDLSWAPYEVGPVFACSCDDGTVHAFFLLDDQWNSVVFEAHPEGCNSVSWCPFLPPSILLAVPLVSQPGAPHPTVPFPRIATCGNDRYVRIWRFAAQDKQWIQEHELVCSSGCPIRTVAWAPSCGLPFSYIALGDDGGTVTVLFQDGLEGKWRVVVVNQFVCPIARVAWSAVGTLLSVSSCDDKVTLWKETADAQWVQTSMLSAAPS